jgi:hypothetical protein
MRTVDHHKAQAVILDAEVNHFPAAEVYRGLEWEVCRQPEKGYRIPGTNIYLIKINPLPPKWPGVIATYTFDDHTIQWQSMEFFIDDIICTEASGV